MPWCSCGSQRTTFGSQFCLSTIGLQGSKSGHQAWQQTPSPESHLKGPLLHFFILLLPFLVCLLTSLLLVITVITGLNPTSPICRRLFLAIFPTLSVLLVLTCK